MVRAGTSPSAFATEESEERSSLQKFKGLVLCVLAHLHLNRAAYNSFLKTYPKKEAKEIFKCAREEVYYTKIIFIRCIVTV